VEAKKEGGERRKKRKTEKAMACEELGKRTKAKQSAKSLERKNRGKLSLRALDKVMNREKKGK
jgi:hypothetical protein